MLQHKKGIKDGPYRYYNEECLLVIGERYVNDILEGEKREFFPSKDSIKVVKKVIPFEAGKENGTAYEYNKEGDDDEEGQSLPKL